jgi:DNA-binding NtrC family response regulator
MTAFSKMVDKLVDKLFNSPSNRKMKLYVIDDVEYYSTLVKVNLEKFGYKNIKIFNNGEDVIEDMNDNNPDCLVLDHILSEDKLNGIDVLRHVNAYKSNINVVILSGQENTGIAAMMMKEGAYDYIIKNEMTFFNLKNTLSRLEDSINEKEKKTWRDKRIKFLLMLIIGLIWSIALLFII